MSDQEIDKRCEDLRGWCIDASPWFWLVVLVVAVAFLALTPPRNRESA